MIHQPDLDRYELRLDGEVVGVLAYRQDRDVLDLLHTEVDDGHEGEGLGGTLVAGALEDVRSRGVTIRPTCPFVGKWLEKHPDQQDLVAG